MRSRAAFQRLEASATFSEYARMGKRKRADLTFGGKQVTYSIIAKNIL